MKIAVTAKGTGIDSQVDPRFGRAAYILVIDTDHAPAQPGASIRIGNEVVGTITSAAWGYRVGKNLALGFVDPALADLGTQLNVDITGDTFAAVVADECLYDPDYERVRA